MFVSQPSISANYSLVLSLWWGFDYEWVAELDLLDVRLVAGLAVRVFSQLESLSTRMILGPEIDKTAWADWIVWVGDFRDNQPL